ncbi:hypothetical protein V1507DRAFT_456262 [Lipomyces tetrasporus]
MTKRRLSSPQGKPNDFNYVLDGGFKMVWDTSPIMRPDVSSNGAARPYQRSLQADGVRGLCSTISSPQWPSTLYRKSSERAFCLHAVYSARTEDTLGSTEGQSSGSQEKWSKSELRNYSELMRSETHLALLDGLHLPVQAARDIETQNAYHIITDECMHTVCQMCPCSLRREHFCMRPLMASVASMTQLCHESSTRNCDITPRRDTGSSGTSRSRRLMAMTTRLKPR